jgi:hypothetical protein
VSGAIAGFALLTLTPTAISPTGVPREVVPTQATSRPETLAEKARPAIDRARDRMPAPVVRAIPVVATPPAVPPRLAAPRAPAASPPIAIRRPPSEKRAVPLGTPALDRVEVRDDDDLPSPGQPLSWFPRLQPVADLDTLEPGARMERPERLERPQLMERGRIERPERITRRN